MSSAINILINHMGGLGKSFFVPDESHVFSRVPFQVQLKDTLIWWLGAGNKRGYILDFDLYLTK